MSVMKKLIKKTHKQDDNNIKKAEIQVDKESTKETKQDKKFHSCIKNLSSGLLPELVLAKVPLDMERAEKLAFAIATAPSQFYKVKFTANAMDDLAAELVMVTIAAKFPSLEAWQLSQNPGISGGALCNIVESIFQHAAQLKEINFSYTALGKEGALLIAESLKAGVGLNIIKLEGCHLGKEGLCQVFEALEGNKSVTTLFLGNNDCDEIMAHLEPLLAVNKTITHLSLDHTKFTLSDFQVIAKLLEANHISRLALENTDLSNESLELILSKNGSLSTLNIGSNALSEGWADIICNYCHSNKTFLSIDISNCGLETGLSKLIALNQFRKIESKLNPWTAKEINAVAALLKSDTSLAYLGLKGTSKPLALTEISIFSDSLKDNKSLLKLDFSDNQIEEESALKLLEGIEHNTQLSEVLLKKNNISPKTLASISSTLLGKITFGNYTKAEFSEMVELITESYLNDSKYIHVVSQESRRRKVISETISPILKYYLLSNAHRSIICREDEDVSHSRIIGLAIWQSTSETLPIEKLMDSVAAKVMFIGQKISRKIRQILQEFETFVNTQTGDADWNLVYLAISKDTSASTIMEKLMHPLQLAITNKRAVCCCLTDAKKIEVLKDWGFEETGEGLLDGKIRTFGLTRNPGKPLVIPQQILTLQTISTPQESKKKSSKTPPVIHRSTSDREIVVPSPSTRSGRETDRDHKRTTDSPTTKFTWGPGTRREKKKPKMERSDKNEKSEKSEKNAEKHEKGDKNTEKHEKSDRNTDKHEKGDKSDKHEKGDKSTDKHEKGDKNTDKHEKGDKSTEKHEKSDKKSDKTEKPERSDKSDKSEKNDKTEKHEKSDKNVKPEKTDKHDKTEKAEVVDRKLTDSPVRKSIAFNNPPGPVMAVRNSGFNPLLSSPLEPPKPRREMQRAATATDDKAMIRQAAIQLAGPGIAPTLRKPTLPPPTIPSMHPVHVSNSPLPAAGRMQPMQLTDFRKNLRPTERTQDLSPEELKKRKETFFLSVIDNLTSMVKDVRKLQVLLTQNIQDLLDGKPAAVSCLQDLVINIERLFSELQEKLSIHILKVGGLNTYHIKEAEQSAFAAMEEVLSLAKDLRNSSTKPKFIAMNADARSAVFRQKMDNGMKSLQNLYEEIAAFKRRSSEIEQPVDVLPSYHLSTPVLSIPSQTPPSLPSSPPASLPPPGPPHATPPPPPSDAPLPISPPPRISLPPSDLPPPISPPPSDLPPPAPLPPTDLPPPLPSDQLPAPSTSRRGKPLPKPPTLSPNYNTLPNLPSIDFSKPQTNRMSMIDIPDLTFTPRKVSKIQPEELEFHKTKDLSSYNVHHAITLQGYFSKLAKRSQFRQTVKDYADSEPGRIGYTRIKILFEFLSTEQSYVKGLNTAIEEWLRPLKANLETKNAVCTKKEVNKIFGSIEVVRNINAEFLARITYWLKVKFPHTAGFADLLLTIAPALNLYVDYVNNYDEARDTFEKLKENNSDFVNWMNNRKSQSGLVGDLSNLLITPVQRVPRYELLIRELIKHTSEKHMDYPLLNKAKEEFVQVNKKVNAKKREQETRQKLVQIERSIVSAAPLILVAPHRMYIKDGLLKFTFKNETLTGIVYILNDCIVLTQAVLKIKDKTVNLFKKTETSPQGTTENHYLETVSLKDLEILYDPNQLQFSLQQGESKYDFLFDTEDNKREWYTSFKEAIDAYALTALFEVAFSKEDKNFYVISAIYGKLRTGTTSTDKSDQIDVTSNILKIIEQQGGNQLILNSGSKSKLFNYTGAKKVKKQLKITCSIKQQVKEFIFQDTEGFVLNADSEPNNK